MTVDLQVAANGAGADPLRRALVRYSLSLRDVEELLTGRGLEADHIEWYEAMHMIRKGQARWVSGSDVRRQTQFINRLFEGAA